MSKHPAAIVLGVGVVIGAAGTGALYSLADQNLDDAKQQRDTILAYAAADPSVPDVGVCGFTYNPSQEVINAYWPACQKYESLREDGENYRLGTYAAAGITGAALLALPVAYLIDTAPGRRARRQQEASGLELRVAPTIGRNTRGIGIVGRF